MLVSVIPVVGVSAGKNNSGVAVIIGNSAYQGGLPEVTYALNDANAFRDYVIDWQPTDELDLVVTFSQFWSIFATESKSSSDAWRKTSREICFSCDHINWDR